MARAPRRIRIRRRRRARPWFRSRRPRATRATARRSRVAGHVPVLIPQANRTTHDAASLGEVLGRVLLPTPVPATSKPVARRTGAQVNARRRRESSAASLLLAWGTREVGVHARVSPSVVVITRRSGDVGFARPFLAKFSVSLAETPAGVVRWSAPPSREQPPGLHAERGTPPGVASVSERQTVSSLTLRVPALKLSSPN